ncbi:zinc-binding dehydrogenase [Kineococcus sp. SYSU DK006]|uniref:zinc-binding dehydrogenase n=1 Tax=Kineococcus sp. SYSU DK006 TaxID=3383127 RepID=UPI003D7DA1E4
MVASSGRAVVARRRGGPERLVLADQEFADPAPGGVRVAVQVAGAAYGDVLLREGLVPGTEFPVTPGYDAVGIIEAVGEGVTELVPGQRVVVRTAGSGGYATHVEVSQDFAVAVPLDLDAAALVALPLNYVSAWQMLTRVAPAAPGSTVLVHGAAGGVGGALAELAQLRGLTVIGTASASRLEALTAGGVVAVDRAGDWVRAVRAAAPDGVDTVFDGVGGATSRRSFTLLGAGGHLVVYGITGGLRRGRRSPLALAGTAAGTLRQSALGLFGKGLGIDGYMSASYVPAYPKRFREDLTELAALLTRRAISPRIAARLPLAQAAEAHRLLADGVSGKIVLDVEGRR